ncbi:hypothetical protein BD289DRAFT_151876 [Coniella lustricola]|uniref:RTA1 like protein-domain-containing protein n=1 Tax=Coniella lustricola TaxID=2025994 RepID=A0A2T2ZUQ2_9PEZI|nr:hypothetical protein BD289DRAFT_151876 [Coniella lustricola]
MSEDGQYVPGSLWIYAPNKGAPVFFAVAFGASTAWQLWQTYHYKCWRNMSILLFAQVLFTGGFIARELAAFDYASVDKLIISVCLLYSAPPLYELSNYRVLGRVLFYVPYLSPIHPGRVLPTFTFISAIIESLNANGAVNSANQAASQAKQNTGKAILKAALLLQIIIVMLFLTLVITVHRRARAAGVCNSKLSNMFWTMYASSALITARTIYRTVEYFSLASVHLASGSDPNTLSAAVRYEWFFYVFEATLMLCNAYLWNVQHPGKYLPRSSKVYLARDGVTEVVGAGYKDPRPYWVTLLDPFDLWSSCTGKRKAAAIVDDERVELATQPKGNV